MSTLEIEQGVRSAMKGVGLDLSSDVLSKCVALVQNHKLEPSQLAMTWEAHSLNTNVDKLEELTFSSFRTALLQATIKNNPNLQTPTPLKTGAVVNRPIMTKRSLPGSPSTSNKHPRTEMASPDVNLVSSNHMAHSPLKENLTSPSSAVVTPSKPTPRKNQQHLYDNRKNAGQIVLTYNPNQVNAISNTNQKGRKCTIHQPKEFPHTRSEYRHMTCPDRATPLNSQLVRLQQEIISEQYIPLSGEEDPDATSTMPALEPVGMPRQMDQTNVGRICNSAQTGKLNSTTVLLEGDRHSANGARISIDVSNLKEPYSLFPGQIIGVTGRNLTGRTLVVDQLIEGRQNLPKCQSSAQELMKLHHGTEVGQGGEGLKVYAVAGPYTTNQNLKYNPWIDLTESILEERPDVVILMGPFVDERQTLLQDGEEVVLEYEGEDGTPIKRHVGYETLFAAKISRELELLYEEHPDLETQFVLVPSLDDAVSEKVYPQPPLKDGPGKVISLFPETDDIPFGSLCLKNIETAGDRKVPKNQADRRVHLVANPSTIQINEVIIGITSTDALFHLNTQEINANLPPGTRMMRMAQHFIQQRSYYPIFPPPTNPGTHMNLDLTHEEAYSMPVVPDILLLPSKLKCLAEEIEGGPIVVNPGHLVKGAMGGTFSVIDIHPMKKEVLEETQDSLEHDLKSRTRAEVRRI